MNLYIQDPTFSDSYSLHEALIQSCNGATCGGGTYAFVTTGGVKLFLEDQAFTEMVSNGTFKLIVGIDEITSVNALRKLKDLREAFPTKLDVYAFLHDTKGSLFHPKFSWFKKYNGGILVLGSGNLTEKGLRRNREAFCILEVDQTGITEIQTYWNNWLSNNSSCLLPVDNQEVLEKARLNEKVYRSIKYKVQLDIEADESDQNNPEHEKPGLTTLQQSDGEDLDAWNYTDEDSLLVAEIPNSNNRWRQANFSKESFINFFGANPADNNQRNLFRNVRSDGTLADVEIRQSVSVASHNYRFELGAATGSYPTDNRPIGIFIRVSTRMFLYVLAMPTDAFYNEVRTFVDIKIPSARGMKRYSTNVNELRRECPNLPFWLI